MQTLQVIQRCYQAFFGSGGLGVALIAALIFLLVRYAKKKEGQKQLIIPTLLIAAVTLCPISAWVIIRAIGEDVYWRVFWMLPLIPVLALALTHLAGMAGAGLRRAAAVLGMAGLIALNGGFVLGGAFFSERTNSYKLPQEVVDVVTIINDHAAANNVTKRALVAPDEIAVYARLVDGSLTQNYGRRALKEEQTQGQLYRLVNSESPDLHVLISKVRKKLYTYLVLRSDAADREVLDKGGFNLIGEVTSETCSYDVYYNRKYERYLRKKAEKAEAAQAASEETVEAEGAGETEALSEAAAQDTLQEDTAAARPGVNRDDPLDVWTVTQYGPRDINAMFYTIHNPRRGLIVVDGGWTEDAEYVRSVLMSLGGVVDAWILTHPHQDHCGAFNAIWPDPGELTIKEVYAVKMPSPEACLEVAPWDSADCLTDFMNLDIPQLTYLSRDDELTLCGLPVKVLNAYDEHVQELSRDYLNDGSLMFEITGPRRSMLFCADVGKSMSDFLLERYKKVIPSDYVQMGHHGNGGLKEDFYRRAAPRTAFFDAPAWLMEDPDGQYNTPEKIALMESLGSKILSYVTAPNSETL